MSRLTLARIAALLLPLAVLAWQVFTLERGLTDHTLWRIPIEGFDPRDPIRGQYVRFSYRWPLREEDRKICEEGLDFCQLCLSGGDGNEPLMASISDGPIPDIVPEDIAEQWCPATVRARQSGATRDESIFGPQRFYLDERHASALQQAINQRGTDDLTMEMEVAVTRDGALFARRVFIDGAPYSGETQPVTEP